MYYSDIAHQAENSFMKLSVSLTVFFLSISFCGKSYAQTAKNNDLRIILEEMAVQNTYEVSSTIGYGGTISKQSILFNRMLHYASSTEMISIATNNKNAVVRLYAFQALKRTNTEIPAALLEKVQKDETIITTVDGCIVNEKKLSDLARQDYNIPVIASSDVPLIKQEAESKWILTFS